MELHVWGVRGSIPSPGRHTIRYGGNTPCVSITLDDNHTLVLDAGTGLHVLGRQKAVEGHTWFLAVSHPHWDHIQGLPMFMPLTDPSNRVEFLCEMRPELVDLALGQFDGIRFPFGRGDIAAHIRRADRYGDANRILKPFGVHLSWIRLNHAGDCFGYRVSTDVRDVVYMTDNELQPSNDVRFDEFVAFCRGADVLIHDAHLIRSDGTDREGWGHSFVEDVVSLAHQAGNRELLLFHHDPMRTDDEIDDLQNLARKQLDDLGSDTICRAAFEGLTVELD